MKIVLQIVLMLVTLPLISQDIWKPIIISDTLESKAINAEKEGVLLVSTGGNGAYTGLFRSTDDGYNWEVIDVDPTSYYVNIFSIRFNSENVLFLGTNARIYRSFNGGESFERVFTSDDNILRIDFSPTGDIYAVGWSYIHRSSDGGDTWETLFDGNDIYFADIDFGLNGEIYTVGGSYNYSTPGTGFHRSLDNGVTWENIGITEFHLTEIEVNSDGVILVGGSNSGTFTSSDNGVSWSVTSDLLLRTLESDAQNNLYAGVGGYSDFGFRYSEDWGSTWINLNDDVLNQYIDQISISPDKTVYVQCGNYSGQEHQLFRSINPIVSVAENKNKHEIKLFPNPANDKLYFSIANRTEIQQINIYNLKRQLVLTKSNISQDYIMISELNTGLYIIEFTIENEIIRKKIVFE